jgi:hypothetical protein
VHGACYGFVGERGETPTTGQEEREAYAYAGNIRRRTIRSAAPASCTWQVQRVQRPAAAATVVDETTPGRQSTAGHRAAMTMLSPQGGQAPWKTQDCGAGREQRRVWTRHAPVLCPPPTYAPWGQGGQGAGQRGTATLPHGAADRGCSAADVTGMLAEDYGSPYRTFLYYARGWRSLSPLQGVWTRTWDSHITVETGARSLIPSGGFRRG